MVAASLGANREVSQGGSLGISKEGSLGASKEGSLEANRQGSMVVSREVLEAHHSLQASCCLLESYIHYMLKCPFVSCHKHLIIGPIPQALLYF